MTAITYPMYAMQDYETAAIYGVGEDLAHALDDARRELRRARVDDVEDALSSLTAVRLSAQAAAYVLDCGGAPTQALVAVRLPGTHITALHLRSEAEE
jgi:hypothetical protein